MIAYLWTFAFVLSICAGFQLSFEVSWYIAILVILGLNGLVESERQ